MTKGIYVSPNTFLSFEEMNTKNASLKQEIASRGAAYDFTELVGLLPDPDPILQKRGDGVEILEQLTGDGHLISVMQSRKMGTLKQEFKWEPGVDEDGKPSSQSEQLCKDFQREFKEVKHHDLISSILDAPYYGMTPIELSYEPGDGHIKLKNAVAKPVRWFGYDEENEPRFKSLDQPDDGEELPWGKFVFARHFPTYDNPYGLRLLSRCFWPITFKKGGLKFWVTFMEKYGMPFLLGHYAKGTSPDEQLSMLDKLKRMVRDAVAVVPEGDKIEMLGGSGKTGGGYMIFDKMKSAMDAEVSKVIQGQTLTSEAGESGSYGLGKVHGEVLSDFQDSDRTLTKTTMDEIASTYGKINTDGVPPPTCKFFEAEDPQTDFANRDKVLEEAGRVKFSKSYYVRRYGYQKDDFELVEPEVTPTPFTELKASKAEEGVISFAEKKVKKVDELELALRSQKQLDELVNIYVQEAGDSFAILKKTLRTWLKGQDSLETALGDVTSLFDLFKADEIESSVFAALIDADRIGTASVPTEDDYAETVWGAGKPFREQLDFFKAKSFSIAGQSNADLVAAVKDEITRTMEDGGDIKSFRASVDELFISKGLDPISSHHIDTIYRTNMQTTFQAGRYTQLTKPHILKARPYWKYVAVSDGNTRPAHKAMNGKIFHHENAIWLVWYPPNGFNCRCLVVSVSKREIERDSLTVSESDLSGTAFETLDKETGRIETFVLSPDTGWSADGRSLERMLKPQENKDGDHLPWSEKKNQSGPTELGRPLQADIPDTHWVVASKSPSIDDLDVSESDALSIIENNYRKTMGIAPLETQCVVRAKDGEAITVTMQALAQTMVKRQDARERYIPFLRDTLEEPYEILLTEYETASGKTKYRKKYIGLYQDEKQEGVVVSAEVGKDGAILWNIMETLSQTIDKCRQGVRVEYGKE
jgi:SPP1 gp7 family putative phage head morphogenesis protein